MIRILIVDDDQHTQTILSTLLNNQGYQVFTADNGREGLETAQEQTPNLIISDIMMPEMNGFRFCRELKKIPELSTIPFIFYSATFVEEEDQKLALSLGANQFVVKPKDNHLFLEIVQGILAGYQRGKFQPHHAQISQADQQLELYEKSMGRKLEETVKRLQQEQCALTLSEKHLKEAQEIANLGHWDYGLKTKIMRWSDQIYRILGFGPQSFPPSLEAFFNSVHAEDLDDVKNTFNKALEHKMSFQKTFRLQLESGLSFVHLRAQVQCDHLGNAVYVIGTLQDINEQKRVALEQERLQNELFQAQKMEALGRLASGISHDFNNLLAIISGHLHQAEKKLSPGHNALANLAQIKAASNRATEMIEQILSYSRCKLPNLKPVSITSCLKENLELLAPTLPSKIELIENIEETDNLVVAADKTQLQQIIINLCKNAIQAMPDQGQLKIGLKAVTIPTTQIPRGSTCMPGSFAQLACSDTGCGMTVDLIEKIFEPFFTTKESGSGTGMGLAVVHNLVHAHGGFITVQSIPGEGTTFNVFLPRHTGSSS